MTLLIQFSITVMCLSQREWEIHSKSLREEPSAPAATSAASSPNLHLPGCRNNFSVRNYHQFQFFDSFIWYAHKIHGSIWNLCVTHRVKCWQPKETRSCWQKWPCFCLYQGWICASYMHALLLPLSLRKTRESVGHTPPRTCFIKVGLHVVDRSIPSVPSLILQSRKPQR